jgi:hypothetical protein
MLDLLLSYEWKEKDSHIESLGKMYAYFDSLGKINVTTDKR